MKKTIILTLVILLFGAYQEAQAYKAILEVPKYDSCYVSFGEYFEDDCAGLYEMEIKIGDTIWFASYMMKNKNCELRYSSGLFMNPRYAFNFTGTPHYPIQDSILRMYDDEAGMVMDVGRVRFRSGAWYSLVITKELKQDLVILCQYESDSVRSNWIFDTQHCTIDKQLNQIGYHVYPAVEPEYPVTITPKEGYEIKSISMDTNSYFSMSGNYKEHLKYTKGDTPDNDWLEINEDGSINVILKGYIEVDGILYSKNTSPEADGIGGNGYCVKVETGIESENKAILEVPEYDSCIAGFARDRSECPTLREIEFQAGDSIWIKTSTYLNKNCESRYAYNIFNLGKLGFKDNGMGYSFFEDSILVLRSYDGAKPDTILGKFSKHEDDWGCFVFSEDLKKDITITFSYQLGYVDYTWDFNNEHCTIDRKPSSTGRFSYPAIYPTYPIKVTPKEGYEIKSISIDTILYRQADGQYSEHVKYTKGDVLPSSDLLEINEDGSVNIILKGYIEVDGVLHPKSWLPGGNFDYYGYHIKVETGTTGIDETAINSKKISPNPSNTSATLTLNLESAGNLRITLNDLLGKELFEIHNEFTDSGNFTKTFSTANLVKGIYYLKIFNNGSFTTEKLVVN